MGTPASIRCSRDRLLRTSQIGLRLGGKTSNAPTLKRPPADRPAERGFWLTVTSRSDLEQLTAVPDTRAVKLRIRTSTERANAKKVCTGDLMMVGEEDNPDRAIVALAGVAGPPNLKVTAVTLEIAPLTWLSSPITTPVLRAALPEAPLVTDKRQFKPVSAWEWSVIREMILGGQPDLDPQLPAASVEAEPRVAVEDISLKRDTATGASHRARVSLRNVGNTTWPAGTIFVVLGEYQDEGASDSATPLRVKCPKRTPPGDALMSDAPLLLPHRLTPGTHRMIWTAEQPKWKIRSEPWELTVEGPVDELAASGSEKDTGPTDTAIAQMDTTPVGDSPREDAGSEPLMVGAGLLPSVRASDDDSPTNASATTLTGFRVRAFCRKGWERPSARISRPS